MGGPRLKERVRAPDWLRGNRNLILFLALMLTIVLLPAFEHSPKGELLFAVVSMFIIFVAVVVNGRSRPLFWTALVLAGPALILRGMAFFTDSAGALLWSWVLSAAVLLATMLRLLQDVFAPGAVSRDRLFGCVTVYILIGLLWCYLYAIIEELSPGALTGLEESRKSLRVPDLAYFSLNVVMTVALTDVLPRSRTAQMMVLLQEFASVFYMAFVIARLVGMYSAPTASTDTDDGGATPKRGR
jgi:hypothetical protein